MFMRTVKSRLLFEQMKGRGVRVIDPTELQAVTPDAAAKTHFIIVDCVGATEATLSDAQPMERKKTVSFKALLEHVALGGTDSDCYSSLATRPASIFSGSATRASKILPACLIRTSWLPKSPKTSVPLSTKLGMCCRTCSSETRISPPSGLSMAGVLAW